jgi:hypothetical protein
MTGAVRWIAIGARLPSAADTQRRSWLAFIPRASATAEIEYTFLLAGPTASALNSNSASFRSKRPVTFKRIGGQNGAEYAVLRKNLHIPG